MTPKHSVARKRVVKVWASFYENERWPTRVFTKASKHDLKFIKSIGYKIIPATLSYSLKSPKKKR